MLLTQRIRMLWMGLWVRFVGAMVFVSMGEELGARLVVCWVFGLRTSGYLLASALY